MKPLLIKSCVLLVTLFAMLATTVYADRGDRRDRDNRNYSDRKDHRDRRDYRNVKKHSHRDMRKDERYRHNHYYPREGRIVKVLPKRRYPIRYRDRDYFYFGGVWYLPSGPGYSIVRPPIGIVVPILPSFYTTIWFGGIPYYYANDTYYLWRADLNGYQVTAPPEEQTQTEPAYLADEIFIYPKEGQSEEQQADDRYACHRWAVEQTGYDPTQPPSDLSTDTLSQQRADYQRAMKTCLEGKGYSVS